GLKAGPLDHALLGGGVFGDENLTVRDPFSIQHALRAANIRAGREAAVHHNFVLHRVRSTPCGCVKKTLAAPFKVAETKKGDVRTRPGAENSGCRSQPPVRADPAAR